MSQPWHAPTVAIHHKARPSALRNIALESYDAIGLRLAKLMSGGRDAHDETRLMLSENVNAMFEAAASVVAGRTASSVVDRYREHVAANARRLSR